MKAQTENKSVDLKKTNNVAVAYDLAEWGEAPALGQDTIIPKILPMQPTSVMVTEGKAVMGEFRDSLSGAKLGSIVEPLEVLPFHLEKFWDIYIFDNKSDKFEWQGAEPLIENPAQAGYNDNLPWSDKTADGVEMKRVRRMNFYVMLPSELAAGGTVPYILSFKSTSFREGKKMFTQMYFRNKASHLPPPAYTFKLSGVKQKNEKGVFIVLNVELGRASTKPEITACLEWFRIIKKGGVKIDDSDLNVSDAAFADVDDTGAGKF